MHSLMWTNDSKLFARDRQDDVAKDYASEWKNASKLAAACVVLAIGDFQRSGRPLGFASHEEQATCDAKPDS